ncbi:MAG: hypothetical protein DK305_000752 [Chloroflexi bacterium]|jgi:hypothetical protein|nr:MAG: hypothetical protein DK305_000752 [Chloroflexota bacterium]
MYFFLLLVRLIISFFLHLNEKVVKKVPTYNNKLIDNGQFYPSKKEYHRTYVLSNDFL